MTTIRRFGADDWIVDDTVGDMTLVGDVETNVPGCPLPSPIDDDIPVDAPTITFD